ncbi:putative nuclease HARBI1 isoform X1 [Musca domestica]|uniref:Nuclease HARBI1 isoform X1 n=1 Tax=Musca domestica TaxID=7370 RepID=A0ABM3VPJ3_MUSDO|nr:putative nuclease HARBI1 isoform X1 [Musca domestica]XP_058987719.1 putative nuclease HARBI1 isoform X1 [Musca domestica]XP_058987720.1 putative nuclease HARBI1 isoform X1 [Musca domestica]
MEQLMYSLLDDSSSEEDWLNEESGEENVLENIAKLVKGCIDGTHVIIDPPKDGRNDYVDRKGHFSLKVQGVCNEKRKFINVFIGYPGSAHDSWVYQNSPLSQNLDSKCGDYFLLGDSAYPCSRYLVTPYRDNGHLTAPKKLFNKKLSSGRVKIEHTFGMVKQRFRQLYYCKLRGVKKLCHFIRACCVLHNLANENDFDFDEISEEEPEVDVSSGHQDMSANNARRDILCLEIRKNITDL